MGLLNVFKKRWLFFVLMLAVGLVIGAAARPAILKYTNRDAAASQEAAASEAFSQVDSQEAAVSQASSQVGSQEAAASVEAAASQEAGVATVIVPTLPAADETASTSIDQPQIDRGDRDSYQGMPVGFTEEGYPYLGDPDAPVTLEEYSDFLCPFCGRHFAHTVPTLIDQYVQTGQVKYVFRDMPLAGLHPTASRGHVAARCAAEQGAGYFWTMHDELFGRQNEWSQLPDPADFLTGVAQALGLDMTAYQECLASGRTEGPVQESVAAGGELGFNGTPSFQFIQHNSGETYSLVGAYPVDTFAQYLDALVAGQAPPQEEEAESEPPELPFWANAEGLAPDPDRPGLTLAGDPYKGNPEAKLVVVEFADFQCPACGQHALEIQPALDEAFVETGDIMWVFKPLPLREHAQAPAAAVAAECAADQGQFWEMHDLIFESLDEWSTAEDPDAVLLALAGELNLDTDQFDACFNSRQALERVLADLYDAQGVVQTTPTFILLYDGRGHMMSGSRPVDQFLTTIQSRLEEASANQ